MSFGFWQKAIKIVLNVLRFKNKEFCIPAYQGKYLSIFWDNRQILDFLKNNDRGKMKFAKTIYKTNRTQAQLKVSL